MSNDGKKAYDSSVLTSADIDFSNDMDFSQGLAASYVPSYTLPDTSSLLGSNFNSAIDSLTLLPEKGGYNIDGIFDSSNPYKAGGNNNKVDTPWYKDGEAMQGYAGLASALLQAFALPSQLKTAKLQQSALKQNINTAKEDQARRNTAINNINKIRPA